MCADCLLEIYTSGKSKYTLLAGFNYVMDNGLFQSQKIIIEASTSRELFVKTLTRKRNPYWGIDIRQCSNTKLNRAIKETMLTDQDKEVDRTCELPFEPGALSSKGTVPSEYFNCSSAGMLGKHCDLSCKDLLGPQKKYCENYRICYKFSDDTICKCSWGFKGPSCIQPCATGNWGLSCESACSSCRQCDKQTGECVDGTTKWGKPRKPVTHTLTTEDLGVGTKNKSTSVITTISYEHVVTSNSTSKKESALSKPETVENAQGSMSNNSKSDTYDSHLKVMFESPGTFNNTFIYHEISYVGKRSGFDDDAGIIKTHNTSVSIKVLPERQYMVNITVLTNESRSDAVQIGPYYSQSGVPNLCANISTPTLKNANTAYFTLNKNIFDDKNGKIIAYSIFLLNMSTSLNTTVDSKGRYGFWDNKSWPLRPRNSRQLTPDFWNPLEKVQTTVFIIGSSMKCQDESDCNLPLKSNSKYCLIVRGLTSAAYRDSSASCFQTASDGGDYILPLIIFLVVLTLVSVGWYAFYKIKKRNHVHRENLDELILLDNLQKPESTAINCTNLQKCLLEPTFFGLLSKQFDSLLEIKHTYQCVIGLQRQNIKKNRKLNQVVPYDDNRVILKPMNGVGTDDYINASYIDSSKRPKAYIASQSPKYSTVKDFWRMIWQEKVKIIVMTTKFVENEKRMCAEYWNQTESTVFECGKIIVKLVKHSSYEFYDCQQFEVYYGITKREIIHFHLKCNFDMFYPNSILSVIQIINQLRKRSPEPILVHSRYGTTETGTFILCDMALQKITCEERVDFYSLARDLNRQRKLIVGKMHHYILAHVIVNEFLNEKRNPFKQLLEQSMDQSVLENQLKYMKIICRSDTIQHKLFSFPNRKKNPFDYALVARYGNDRKYLACRQPWEEEIEEFWKMIAAESIHCILFLQMNHRIWTCKNVSSTNVVQVTYEIIAEVLHLILRKVSLLVYENISKKIIHDKTIFVFEFQKWKVNKLLPTSINNFIAIVNNINQVSLKEEKVLVCCSDGITASGLFVVTSYILEKYERELEVDICNAIRIARRSGKMFVQTAKQLAYIYACIRDYIQNYEQYQQIDMLETFSVV